MRRRNDHRASAGVAAIEFAIIFPVLVLLFFVMVNLSQYITMNRRLADAANLVTDLVTRNRTVVPSDLTDYFQAAALALRPASTTTLAIDVYVYQQNAGGTVVSRWKKFLINGSGTNPTVGTAASCTAPNTTKFTTLIKTSDIVVTVVCMTFTPPVRTYGTTQFFSLLPRIRQESVMRPRLATTLECTPTTCT